MGAKILATSCWHVDRITRGVERADDVLAQVERMVDAAFKERVDLFLFLGDLLEGHRPDERVYTLLTDVARTLNKLSDVERNGISIPVLMLAGNHDVVDRAGCRCALSPLANPDRKRLLADSIGFVNYPQMNFGVLTLPHTSRAHEAGDPATVAGALLAHLAKTLPGYTLVAASHMKVRGAIPGSERDMPRGEEGIWLPDVVLHSPQVMAILQGHYHRAGEIPRGGVTHPRPWDPMIHVVGSPERHTFGEATDDKGYTILELP